MRNITFVIILGFAGVACDQVYDAQKNSEQSLSFLEDEYNRLTLDTAYVNEMYEAYQERSGNDKMTLTLTQNEYGDTKGYELTDTTFDVNVFAGPEEL